MMNQDEKTKKEAASGIWPLLIFMIFIAGIIMLGFLTL